MYLKVYVVPGLSVTYCESSCPAVPGFAPAPAIEILMHDVPAGSVAVFPDPDVYESVVVNRCVESHGADDPPAAAD